MLDWRLRSSHQSVKSEAVVIFFGLEERKDGKVQYGITVQYIIQLGAEISSSLFLPTVSPKKWVLTWSGRKKNTPRRALRMVSAHSSLVPALLSAFQVRLRITDSLYGGGHSRNTG